MAEGIPPEEVRDAVATAPKKKVDPKNLAAALEHPDTRRRFVTIHTDDELEAMLAAPLEKWRCFLHPSQERLVTRSFNGPAQVLGGAGTGKTVVAMHRSRHLAAKVFTAPSDRVLVTTYTGNLAENIEAILKSLCGEEQSRIEVVHLHAFAVRLLRSHGVERDIASPEFKFRRFQGGSRAARRVKFPPANRSWRGAGGRDLRPKCHLPCSAEKLGELGDPGFQARLFWKRLWHFFLVADPPQGRQHVGKRWLFLLPVPRSEGKT